MKRKGLLGLIVMLSALFGTIAFAGEAGEVQTTHPVSWNRECTPLKMLNLSAEQSQAVKRFESQYKRLILQYRQDLMVKRLELRDKLRNSDASEASVREKFEELEETRRTLHEKMVNYQLHIRTILTPEQLSRWCTMIGEPVSGGGSKGGSW